MARVYFVKTIHGAVGEREGYKSSLVSFYNGEGFETVTPEYITIGGETVIADSVIYKGYTTKKEAEQIVAQYNANYAANGTAADE